jgi:hypothetical protein
MSIAKQNNFFFAASQNNCSRFWLRFFLAQLFLLLVTLTVKLLLISVTKHTTEIRISDTITHVPLHTICGVHLPQLLLWPTTILKYHNSFGQCNAHANFESTMSHVQNVLKTRNMNYHGLKIWYQSYVKVPTFSYNLGDC